MIAYSGVEFGDLLARLIDPFVMFDPYSLPEFGLCVFLGNLQGLVIGWAISNNYGVGTCFSVNTLKTMPGKSAS